MIVNDSRNLMNKEGIPYSNVHALKIDVNICSPLEDPVRRHVAGS